MNNSYIVTIEQYILKCIFEKPILIKKVENFFISEDGKSFFKVFKSLINKEEDINEANILKESTCLSLKIDKELLVKFKQIDVDLNNFDKYLISFKQNSILNEIRGKEVKNLVKLVESKESISLDAIIETFEGGLQKLKSISIKKQDDYTIQDILNMYTEVIKDRSKGKYQFPTGCALMDKVNMIGYEPSYITTVFANTGVGKSTYRKYLVNRSLNSFIPTVENSLEMSTISEADRLIALRNNIPISMLYNKQNDPDITAYVLDIIENEKKKLKYNSLYLFHGEPVQDLKHLDNKIPEWKEKLSSDYLVVHVDLMSMLKDYSKVYGNKANVIEDAQNVTHEIARKHNVHIVQYLQALREDNKIVVKQVEDLERYRPKLNNIKNGSAFENRSRVVLGLFRPRYYGERYLIGDPEVEIMTDVMEVQFLKQSMGHLPILKYYFDGATSTMYPLLEKKEERED